MCISLPNTSIKERMKWIKFGFHIHPEPLEKVFSCHARFHQNSWRKMFLIRLDKDPSPPTRFSTLSTHFRLCPTFFCIYFFICSSFGSLLDGLCELPSKTLFFIVCVCREFEFTKASRWNEKVERICCCCSGSRPLSTSLSLRRLFTSFFHRDLKEHETFFNSWIRHERPLLLVVLAQSRVCSLLKQKLWKIIKGNPC